MQTNDPNDNAGHRDRLRKRFDETGLDGFADHEVLELLLFYTFARKDTKPVAKALLKELGSLEKVLSADQQQLCSVPGMGEASARLFIMLRALMQRISRNRLFDTSLAIASGSVLMDYLGTSMESLPEEQLRVIFVNNLNRVIKDEVLSSGTEDQTAVYPRKIMKRAMALHATGIIVVHNHPTGHLRPSNADINITRQLVAAAATLDLRFLDHVIVGREEKGYFSFRESGML
ncbi:MAG: DNA repair protein RadC [Candidatus Riflebacteria bacterium]|nr:DNA repair protein RadC [Candidatus Riflebacteria bacterium]